MLAIEKFVPRVDHLPDTILQQEMGANVLRLDLIHPIVSGNKWYKLKEYLLDAKKQNKKKIITFGGAYSNHIIATAAACIDAGFEAIGIIRGEKPKQLSHTLQNAMALGMQLHFVSREEYKMKHLPAPLTDAHEYYAINEGGYGEQGSKGVREMTESISYADYTHILAAVGTGTTLAGLIEASNKNQTVIGVSALKGNNDLEHEINHLLTPGKKNCFVLMHQYHFGGYAKYTTELLQFMNGWYSKTGIPLDFVYTAKLFYAFHHLCKQSFFPKNSNVLLVHSGGLQGNDSLKKGTLIF